MLDHYLAKPDCGYLQLIHRINNMETSNEFQVKVEQLSRDSVDSLGKLYHIPLALCSGVSAYIAVIVIVVNYHACEPFGYVYLCHQSPIPDWAKIKDVWCLQYMPIQILNADTLIYWSAHFVYISLEYFHRRIELFLRTWRKPSPAYRQTIKYLALCYVLYS